MQRHVILTFVGVVLAAALVAWVRPEQAGGTTFLVVVTILGVNAVGAAGGGLLQLLSGGKGGKPASPVAGGKVPPKGGP